MATKKEIAKKESTKIVKAAPLAIDFSADVGAGMEGTDASSFAIPFLAVIQKMSPQCEETDAKFIDGAKAGQLFNSVTSKLYDGKEGVIILPVAYQRRFIQWGSRSGTSPGFKGEFTLDQVMEKTQRGEVVDVEGKIVVLGEEGKIVYSKDGTLMNDTINDTRNHFCILIDADKAERVLISLSSTQIKKSKNLMALLSNAKIDGKTPPTWMSRIKMTVVPESNAKGSWHGVKFEADGFIGSMDLYNQGKEFWALINEGSVGVNYASMEPSIEPGESDKF